MCPGMLVERTRLGVAVLDGYLYAVGGSNGQQCLSSIERYVGGGGVRGSRGLIPCLHERKVTQDLRHIRINVSLDS